MSRNNQAQSEKKPAMVDRAQALAASSVKWYRCEKMGYAVKIGTAADKMSALPKVLSVNSRLNAASVSMNGARPGSMRALA